MVKQGKWVLLKINNEQIIDYNCKLEYNSRYE